MAVACGGDSETDSDDAAPTTESGASGTAATDDPTGSSVVEDDDRMNPVALGIQVSGPTGSSLELEVVAYADGQAQQPMDLVANVRDEPWFILLTNFIESAEVSAGAATGGPLTVETIRGRAVDPDDPTAGIEVIEVLETVEIAEGDSVNLEMP